MSIVPAVVHTPCPLCGADEGKLLGRFHFFETELGLVECRCCHLAYVSPRPNEATLSSYFQTYTDVFSEQAIEHWYENKKANVIASLRRLRARWPRGKMLDVGCGHGFFLQHARELGYEPWGTEISQPACDYGSRAGLQVLCGQLTELALPSGSFDVVTSFDMLDYAPDPLAQMVEMRRLLRPGGALMIGVLNRISLAKAWQRLGALSGRRATLDHNPFFEPDHLVQFTPYTLCVMLERAGFQEITTFNAKLSSWHDNSRLIRYCKTLADAAWEGAWRLSGGSLCLATGVTALACRPLGDTADA